MSNVDAITLESARRGDRDAQNRLLRTMQDVWFRFALSQLGDEHLARDATQETALRVLTRLADFRGESSFKTWSIGFALNVCRELRRSKLRLADVDHVQQAEPASEADALDAGLIGQESAGRVRALIDGLPPRQREAMVLRFFEDMSIDEVARSMDAAPGTIKATIFAAMKKLKDALSRGTNNDHH
jgi:RNA polymerase sigma-70 factor, ECF subfamily